MKKPNAIEIVAKPNVQPWDRYRFVKPELRKETWLGVCEDKERKASFERMAAHEARYRELHAAGDLFFLNALRKMSEERQFQMKHGWVRMPWEEAVQA